MLASLFSMLPSLISKASRRHSQNAGRVVWFGYWANPASAEGNNIADWRGHHSPGGHESVSNHFATAIACMGHKGKESFKASTAQKASVNHAAKNPYCVACFPSYVPLNSTLPNSSNTFGYIAAAQHCIDFCCLMPQVPIQHAAQNSAGRTGMLTVSHTHAPVRARPVCGSIKELCSWMRSSRPRMLMSRDRRAASGGSEVVAPPSESVGGRCAELPACEEAMSKCLHIVYKNSFG